jgi:hypothetical protein
MCALGGLEVEQAVAQMAQVLAPHATRDWRVPAGSLEWSCWETAVHVAHDLLAYAGQVAGGPSSGYLPFDLTVPAGTPPPDVLAVIAACGGMLSSAVATASPQARGWHWGPTDPEGFAALGSTSSWCTATTSLEVSKLTGDHQSHCARRCWAACSRTLRLGIRSRCCCGAPAGSTSRAGRYGPPGSSRQP